MKRRNFIQTLLSLFAGLFIPRAGKTKEREDWRQYLGSPYEWESEKCFNGFPYDGSPPYHPNCYCTINPEICACRDEEESFLGHTFHEGEPVYIDNRMIGKNWHITRRGKEQRLVLSSDIEREQMMKAHVLWTEKEFYKLRK